MVAIKGVTRWSEVRVLLHFVTASPRNHIATIVFDELDFTNTVASSEFDIRTVYRSSTALTYVDTCGSNVIRPSRDIESRTGIICTGEVDIARSALKGDRGRGSNYCPRNRQRTSSNSTRSGDGRCTVVDRTKVRGDRTSI